MLYSLLESLEEPDLSTFRVEESTDEDEMLVRVYQTIQCHIPEDNNFIVTAVRTQNFAHSFICCQLKCGTGANPRCYTWHT
jgi:tRNA(Ser,Leu) C12 N-acetylase TAN1